MDATTDPSTDDLDRRSSRLGLVTTLAVAIPVLVDQVAGNTPPLVANRVGWWLAWGVFVATLLVTDEWRWPRSPAWDRLALAVLTASGLAAVALAPTYGFSVVLPIVTAASAAFLVSFRAALVLVVVQAATIVVVYLTVPEVTTGEAILQGVAWGGFMGFAVFTVEAGARQARARERLAALNEELATANARLARSNAELEEAQRQLAASSRNAERLRISRDLHDLIGHQLTALTLQLEAASHRGAGPASDNVTRARAIARDLLGDVREVVGRLREDAAPPDGNGPVPDVDGSPDGVARDLARRLQETAGAVTSLEVSLEVDASALPGDRARATTVLRVVQEVVTNAARHARAEHLWISIGRRGDDLVVTAHDDGRGAATLEPGNGLVGMRERVATLGGTVATWTIPGEGFHVEATFPDRGTP
jgi:signal transduction histidine kinase